MWTPVRPKAVIARGVGSGEWNKGSARSEARLYGLAHRPRLILRVSSQPADPAGQPTPPQTNRTEPNRTDKTPAEAGSSKAARIGDRTPDRSVGRSVKWLLVGGWSVGWWRLRWNPGRVGQMLRVPESYGAPRTS